jgi:hypothetical protein
MNKHVYIRKWSKDKPLFIAISAEYIASASDYLLQFFNILNNGVFFEKFPITTDSTVWLKLYFNHRKVIKIILDDFKSFEGMAELGAYVYEYLNQNKLKPEYDENIPSLKESIKISNSYSKAEKQSCINETIPLLKEIYECHLKELETDFNEEIDDDTAEKLTKFFQKPEWLFLLTVISKSFFYYGEYPSFILRKARLGNKESIQKILSLDSSTLGDKKIFNHFHRSDNKEPTIKKNEIIRALSKNPKGFRTLQTVKYHMAGFISVASEKLGYRLKAMEIEKLFSAISDDFNVDLLLNENPDVFDKTISERIRKSRKFWFDYFTPNKKKS